MDPATLTPEQRAELPDHTRLPDTDGSIVENTQEHPQANLLTDCLLPRLHVLHPDGQFAVCCDVGIYWSHTPPDVLQGCKAPDWFYVPGVPPMLHGEVRRSYVMWQEQAVPLILVEFVSRDGSEEHDQTPGKGKFWVYEQMIRAPYYAIFDGWRNTLEVYHLENGRYQRMEANQAGRYPIPQLRIELGLWQGTYRDITGPWLRVWDADTGKLIPLSEERAETAEALIDETRQMLSEETERAETERKRAEDEKRRADAEKARAEEQQRQAEDEKRRADAEKARAEDEKRRADAVEKTLTDAHLRLQQLAEKLRALGIDPEG